jgi:hypothetical protein
MYGPYASLAAGTYVIDIQGRFDRIEDAIVDVVSDQGHSVHFKRPLASVVAPSRDRARFVFHLDKPANGLEVRLAVGASDRIAILGYKLMPAAPKDVAAFATDQPANGIEVPTGDMALLPHVVGTTDARGRHSDGRKGYLMYGPYRPLPPGRYRLRVRGEAATAKGAWIDVASATGKHQHAEFDIGRPVGKGLLVDAVVVIDAPVQDLEVRVFVTPQNRVSITGYTLLREGETTASP